MSVELLAVFLAQAQSWNWGPLGDWLLSAVDGVPLVSQARPEYVCGGRWFKRVKTTVCVRWSKSDPSQYAERHFLLAKITDMPTIVSLGNGEHVQQK